MYVGDYDGSFPQTRKGSADPSIDDASGEMEEPDFGPTFKLFAAYHLAGDAAGPCPSDQDPHGKLCDGPFPDHPDLDSYITNGWFAFGLKESQVKSPATTVYLGERRSEPGQGTPYCSYLYRPWFNPTNPKAPENDMDPADGALSSRHVGSANYSFADGHMKKMKFSQTYDPASGINMHKP